MASACASNTAHSAPSDRELTIGYIPIACAAPLILAHSKGMFEQQGVRVTLKKFAGWADLWSAYATGLLDIAHMLSPMPLAINAGATNGTRPTEVLFTQNTNGQAITLASKHAGHVTTAADFRNKVIGIPFEYSVHALLVRDYLESQGVNTRTEVELRLLRPSDMVAQLRLGGIDGFVGPEPFNQRAIDSGAGRIFELTKQLWPGHPCCSVAVSQDWRASHAEDTAALTRALADAAEFANNPEQQSEVANILAQEKYLNQPAELLLPALSGHYHDWHDKPTVDHERIIFGSPTDSTALTWMATQIARWDLGGNAITMDDAALIRLADSVLPATPPAAGPQPLRSDRIVVNGREFDPNLPTLGY